MAMADTTPGKIYDIAEKLGYEGARTQSSAKGVYACADALGFVGPHARRITDALSDLKTVVGGGGGGGDLGYPIMVTAYTSGSASLGFFVTSEEIYLYFYATVGSQSALPTGATYLIGDFRDAGGIDHAISSASDVTATISYDMGDTSEAFTDYEIVDGDDGKAVQLTTTAAAPSQDPPPLITFTIAT